MKTPRSKPPVTNARRIALFTALSGAGALGHALAKPIGTLGSGNGPPITINGLIVSPPSQSASCGELTFQFGNKTTQRYWVFVLGQGSSLTSANPSKVTIWYLDDKGNWQREPTMPPAQTTAYLLRPDQTITLSFPKDSAVEFQTRPLTRDE
ncbi:MAG: hypothetical protein C4K60_16020 [Ideonella sp. MAG2]|nr:MAG: hypothetical protein C4K60_16020 [Ideonella sp. MAG2]